MEQETAHSVVGASSMKRVITCPKSVQIHRELLEDGWVSPTSEASLKGTAVHNLIEKCVVEKKKPDDFLNSQDPKTGVTYTDIEVSSAKYALKEIKRLLKKEESKDALLLMEECLTLPSVHEECFGTADISIVQPFDRAVLRDYKNGTYKVVVKDNLQLAFYAIGLADKYELNEVEIGIIQPNIPNPDKQVVVLKKEDLDKWRKEIREAVERTFEKDAPLVMSDECYFCPAKQAGRCELYRKKQTEAVLDVIVKAETAEAIKQDREIILPEYEDMTDEQKVMAFRNINVIQDWFEGLKKHTLKTFDDSPVQGLKKAQGRQGPRSWTSPKEVEEKLVKEGIDKDTLYKQSFKSPTQLEAELGKTMYTTLITDDMVKRSEGKFSIVLDDDMGQKRLKEKKKSSQQK